MLPPPQPGLNYLSPSPTLEESTPSGSSSAQEVARLGLTLHLDPSTPPNAGPCALALHLATLDILDDLYDEDFDDFNLGYDDYS